MDKVISNGKCGPKEGQTYNQALLPVVPKEGLALREASTKYCPHE